MPAAVLLPWEHRRTWLGALVPGQRWRGMLVAAALGAAVIIVWRFADHRARLRATRASIAEVQRAVAAFRAEMGRCPHAVVELLHPPRAAAHSLTEVPTDGWGRPLHVRCPGQRPGDPAEVISAGPGGSFAINDSIL